MSSPRRTAADLLRLASQYARERAAPVQTLVKEMLHFEILQALTVTGATNELVFQGGTCLRLCYRGNRYSEDLDFAAGPGYDFRKLGSFEEILANQLADAYSLDVAVKSRAVDSDGMHLQRWQAKIAVPQADASLPQKQVINIEIADIPAHQPDLVPIQATYPHLTAGQRSLMVLAETQHEILADKIKALVARPFLKARDIWDIKFLLDGQQRPDYDLVKQKLVDYGWSIEAFRAQAEQRLADLRNPAAHAGFRTEMSRFVDGHVARMLDAPGVVGRYMAASAGLVESTIKELGPRQVVIQSGPEMSM